MATERKSIPKEWCIKDNSATEKCKETGNIQYKTATLIKDPFITTKLKVLGLVFGWQEKSTKENGKIIKWKGKANSVGRMGKDILVFYI